jgi:hypothetical protein
MDTFVSFKKSSWHRLFEKGELAHEQAMDEWHKARNEFYQSKIHAAHVEMLENSPLQSVVEPNAHRHSVYRARGYDLRTRRVVDERDPNERILYYTGHTKCSMEPMFGGPLADPLHDHIVHLRDAEAMTRYMIAANVIAIEPWRDRYTVSYKAWGGMYEDPLAGLKKPIVNVGTIGHCDYMGPQQEILPPLQQAIRDINHGKRQ